MKISLNYIILNIVTIGTTGVFTVFILLFEMSDPEFPTWITVLSTLALALSVYAFLSNFKNLEVDKNKIRVKRLLGSDLVVRFSDIETIVEAGFRYRGGSPSSYFYKGFYLTIMSNGKTIKTSSLNEPDYAEIRKRLKKALGDKVKLSDDFQPGGLHWVLVVVMAVPMIYLLMQIKEKIS